MKKNPIILPLTLLLICCTTVFSSVSTGMADNTVDLDEYILSSFLGGISDDLIRDMAIDSEGNILVTGDTMSENFPTRDAFQDTFAGGIQDVHTVSGDAFIAKFNSIGNLIWASYLGGSSNDGGIGVHVDSVDNIYVVGVTNSLDFPVTGSNASHGGSDKFVTKFASNGTLIFSMCIGTSEEENLEGSIMFSDLLTITGSTTSPSFPITETALQPSFEGQIDGTIVQVLPNGSIYYSSFFGGSGVDVIGEIYASESGKYIINGYSDSPDLPFTENAYSSEISGPGRDFFIAVLTTDMEIEYCTYFGGSGVDDCFGCTFDTENSMIFSGRTWSVDFPIANAWQSTYSGVEGDVNGVDAFVTKINSTGQIVFSSYFGGLSWDTLHFVDTDDQNNIFTCGDAPTNDFPVFSNAIQEEIVGNSDIVFLVLNPEGKPYFGTYFGGSNPEHVWNMERFSDHIYIVGHTASVDFPVTSGVFQENKNGSQDGFFLRFDLSKYLEDYPQKTKSRIGLEFGVILSAIILFTRRRKKA